MSKHPLLHGARGERHVLLGNEAIVRGALEAGVNMVTCYPGTPSSEVPDTFYKLGGEGRYKIEYAVNEKVAFEVAAGAALGGAQALVTMKHVGLNVAADPLFTSVYTGLPGGLVVLSADDPGCHSSQNEQDNRYYARFASLPCFEPVSAQEAKDMTREAFRLARELQQPVLLRTTTRVSHMRGNVEFDDLPAGPAPIVDFQRNPGRFVPVPAVARGRHRSLLEIMEKARAFAESSRFSREYGPEGCRLGIIASGVARNYLADALASGGWEERVRVLELGMTWPLPEGRIEAFLQSCDRVLVLEEGEPLLEGSVRALAQKCGCKARIEGKDDTLTVLGEYSTTLVLRRVADYLDCPCPVKASSPVVRELPVRPPNLCAGCSHRAVYYAVRHTFGDDAYYSSDIGCYTLGMVPPLRAADFLFCMGSSVSAGSGFAMVSDRPVVGFIGDSTFFHSGMTGLANAVFNKHDVLLVILDNGTTAMTGHQPNPGVCTSVLGEGCNHLDIESVVRGIGVTDVAKVKPFNMRGTLKTIEEMKARSGVRVIIAEEPCMLFARRTLKQNRPQVAEVATQGEEALKCLAELACPAFRRGGTAEAPVVSVDESQCSGCMVCLQVTPAIRARKRS